jgi:hypothetical protein
LPSAKRLTDLDQTLYLSKSTFYNDVKPPHNIVGIPIAPPPPPQQQPANITKGRTTIIPIRVEGRDEPLAPDLMQFDSLENIPPQTRINSANSSNTSNGLSRCIPSLPSPSSFKSETSVGYPISDQVDGRILRHSYDVATKCRNGSCNFFGSPKNGYCSKCSQQLDEQQQPQQFQQYRKLQTEI